MAASRSRKHTFTITVTFDKACPASVALREVKDNIYGEHYTTPNDDSEPETFRVARIGRVKKSS